MKNRISKKLVELLLYEEMLKGEVDKDLLNILTCKEDILLEDGKRNTEKVIEKKKKVEYWYDRRYKYCHRPV